MAIAENLSMEAMWDGGTGRQLPEVTSSSSETFRGHGSWTLPERTKSSSVIETCPFSPTSDLKTCLRNLWLWHSICLIVHEKAEDNHLPMIYFFKVMVCYKEKQVDLSVLAQSPVSLAIVCKSLTSDQKKSHLFIGKKATSDSLYLPACSFLEECCLQWNVVEGRKTSFYTVSVVVIIRRNPPPTVEAAAFVAVSVLCLPSSFD